MIPYSGDMVKLYAEYDRQKLLPFLKSSNNYQLDMALNIVETREFVPEQVYLLGLYNSVLSKSLRKHAHAMYSSFSRM